MADAAAAGGSASLGFITVTVPPGVHLIEARFGPTTVRLLAEAVSWSTLAGVTAFLALNAGGAAGLSRASLQLLLVVSLLATASSLLVSSRAAQPLRRLPPNVPISVRDVELLGQTTSGARLVELGGETRRWLSLALPATARLRVPGHALLQIGLAAQGAVPARFTVEVEGHFGRQTVLDRQVDPGADHWVDEWIDLEFLNGEEVRLTLSAEPPEALPGLANPQLVVWDSATRPYPGTRHLW
jgi:hypothetical protein